MYLVQSVISRNALVPERNNKNGNYSKNKRQGKTCIQTQSQASRQVVITVYEKEPNTLDKMQV